MPFNSSLPVDARIPRRVMLVIAASIALLLVNAVWLVVNARATWQSHQQYVHSFEIKRSLAGFQAALGTAESAQRGYLLTTQEDFLAPYHVAMDAWRKELARLRTLGGDSHARQQELDELQSLTETAVTGLRHSIENRAAVEQAAADAERTTTAMDAVRGQVERLIAEEDARIDARNRQVLRDLLVLGAVALLTTIVAVIVLLGLTRLLSRYVRQREAAERSMREVNQQLNQQVELRTAELRQLSQHLLQVSEQEKAVLARDLHDTLGSSLTAINMDLSWVLRRVPDDLPEVRERLQRAMGLLVETVELKHAVIEGLRPSHLDNLGLGFALRAHCGEFTRRTGLPCDLRIEEEFDELDPAWSIAFYRIVQESLTNIVRHAQASRVAIALLREPGGLRLTIEDDGVGLAGESLAKPTSHGVLGMRERMRQLGGVFSIDPRATGSGTRVEAFVAWPAQA